jgi:Calx-beta domain/FG-GAP-like repeat
MQSFTTARLTLIVVASLALVAALAAPLTRSSAALPALEAQAGCANPSFATGLSLLATSPSSIAIGDFNQDTHPDMAIAETSLPGIRVYLGDGAGGFGTSQTFESGFFSPISVKVGDINGDTKPDLIVADYFMNKVVLMIGAGNGSFGAPSYVNVGNGPYQVDIGDVNHDGKLDFATTAYFDLGVSVFLGDGAGNFAAASGSPFTAARGLRALRMADLNGNGDLDIVAVNYDANNVSVLLGNGSGGFVAASGTPALVGSAPVDLATGDFNLDGKLDVVTANSSNGSSVSTLLGDGTGHFQTATFIASGGSTPRAVITADLNGDGRSDIICANQESHNVAILLSTATNTFVQGTGYVVGQIPRSLALADFDHDGNLDLSVGASIVSVLMGKGGGVFNGIPITRVDFNPAQGIASGDFNGDSKTDMAVSDAGGVISLLGDGGGGFTRAGHFGGSAPSSFIAAADLNGDTKLDLITASGGAGSTVGVMLGLGNGTFGSQRNFPIGSSGGSPMSIATGDFNGDGKIDVATSNYGAANVTVLLGDGNGGLLAPTANLIFGQTPFVAAGDFNNDGNIDLIAVRRFFDSSALLLGDGAGHFMAAPNSPIYTGQEPQAIAVDDFNGDGNADLAVVNIAGASFEPNVAILFGTGQGTFPNGTSYRLPTPPSSVTVTDINSDGHPDLAITNGLLSILLNDGTGGFGLPTNFPGGKSAVFITAFDANSDGRPDLLAALGNGVGLFANTCTAPPLSLPTLSVSDADVTEADAGTINLVFTVTLSAASSKTVTVGYNTFGSTAGSNVDFQRAAGRLVLAPGTTTQTVTVQVNGDTTDEFDEVFGVDLTLPLNATLSRARATGAILDNDPPPHLSINDVSVTEGNASVAAATLTATLTQVSGKPITVQYATADGSAVAGNDYVSKSGTLTIPAGSLSASVSVNVNGDSVFETDESFTVNLSNPSNAIIDKAQGSIVITNDDPQPTINAEDISVSEGQAGTTSMDFKVRLSNASYQSITVNYATADGSANAGSDYVATTGTVTFAPGVTENTVTVPVNGDAIAEQNESLFLNLTNAGNASIGRAQATGTIVSDDAPVIYFEAASVNAIENEGSALFRVRRDGNSSSASAVDFATADASARQIRDYTLATGTLTFAPGETARTFRVLITDDLFVEGNETVSLILSGPTGTATLGSPAIAELVITDNDSSSPTTNPLDNADAQFFVRQHYYDFLSRLPDPGGFAFWTGQITQCGTDPTCLRTKTVDVSNAFYYELEYQQTGSYVYRLYRAAFGNNQPLPNPFPNPQYPNEEKKLPSYLAFAGDRARVRGGANLAQLQLELANAFVLRPEFQARYPVGLDGPAFVDSLLALINSDIGVDLGSQRTALLDLFNQGGRGAVLYRLADDNLQTNPINNRAFIDAEYNRAFVVTQYFGYLRRNPDIAGFVFWLGQVNGAPLRDVQKQHAMVCSFITSSEYQLRFSSIVTHNNAECAQ